MKSILISLLAILLLIEEWLWETLSAIGHFLAVHLGLIHFENWLIHASRYQALIAISIPILIVTPINLFALFLLAQGLWIHGIILEIVAKLFGTLFVARFFKLAKPQLLTFIWIAWLNRKIGFCLHWAHQKVSQTQIYQSLKKLKITLKQRLQLFFNQN